MNAFQFFLLAVTFLYEHHDEIIEKVKQIQALMEGAPGDSKMAVLRGWIGVALNAEESIEKNWGLVAPVFNWVVAKAKGKVAVA